MSYNVPPEIGAATFFGETDPDNEHKPSIWTNFAGVTKVVEVVATMKEAYAGSDRWQKKENKATLVADPSLLSTKRYG